MANLLTDFFSKIGTQISTGLSAGFSQEEQNFTPIPQQTVNPLNLGFGDRARELFQSNIRGSEAQQRIIESRRPDERAVKAAEEARRFAQTIFKQGAGLVISAFERVTGTEGLEFTARTEFQKFILGPDPVKNIAEQGKQTMRDLPISFSEETIEEYGGNVGIALLGLDLIGPGKNTLIKLLAKTDKVGDVAKILKGTRGIADDIIPKIAPKIAKTGDTKVIGKILDDVIPKIGPAAPKAIRAADDVNLERFNFTRKGEAKARVLVSEAKEELEAIRGAPLSHKEVLEAAEQSDMLARVTTKKQTLAREAATLRARQQFAAIASGEAELRGASREFVDTLRVISSEATSAGRQLEALKIGADPKLDSLKRVIVQKLVDIGVATEDIVRASAGVDFNNADEAANFYRRFIKPTFGEIIDEYRYINLLSSPRTHGINAFSNFIQATALAPATKLASGAIDLVASRLTGKARQHYIKEVPAYAKGAFNALHEAASSAMDALSGRIAIRRPDVGFSARDLGRIPTQAKILKPFRIIPRALEAGDIYFRTLIKAGEIEALTKRAMLQGKTVNKTQIASEAAKRAEYFVFRQALDGANKTGQGKVLSLIDKATEGLYSIRAGPVKWVAPFVQTPMNIFKQGIEYSPLGFSTVIGSTRKTEQLGKAMIGSMVFAGAADLAFNDQTTWAAPTNEKEREAFFAAGMQPYSVKIGDSWVAYSKVGPVAYPMAMAAALKYYVSENPEAATQGNMEKVGAVLAGIAGFLADQSYVEGIGTFVRGLAGEEGGLAKNITGFARQLVPLASLQTWVAQMIDPVFRDPSGDTTPEEIAASLAKSIPFASMQVAPYLDPAGEESLRANTLLGRIGNQFSPLRVTKEDPAFREYYDTLTRFSRRTKVETKTKKQVKSEAEELYEQLDQMTATDAEEEFQKIVARDRDLAGEIKDMAEEDALGLTYQDKFLKSLGVQNQERALVIAENLLRMETGDERIAYIQELQGKRVISDTVLKQVTELYNDPDELHKLSRQPTFQNFGKEVTEGEFISNMLIYANALGVDPISAFHALFSNEQIRKTEGGTVIFLRMPREESSALRASWGATDDQILDHKVPLELGGSNSKSNLWLVPERDWEAYSPVENHLGRLLRSGKMTERRAKKLILDFKEGRLTAEEVYAATK